MRNLLKLIKNLSFLLCFGFGLNYMVVPVMAQSIVPPVIEEEAPDEEEIGGWSTLDKKTQETIAKNQARNAAAGQSDEARAIYDAQQQRYDQRDASKEKYADTLNAGDERIRNMEALTEQAQQGVAAAQERLKNASTPEEMKAANEALKQAQQDLKTAEKNQKEVEKDVKKDVKKDNKAAKKEAKKEEKCAKGKCDDEDLADLAAARASAESAQTALDAANQKANAFYAQDEDEAAAEYMAERDAQEASIAAADDADGIIEQAKEDLAEAQSNAPKMCSADEIGGNVFLLIACKATTTLADLRVIAYIISGFGMVALAYAAIFGKMNWKHLANIGIGLFLLSMMTPFIEYFTTGKDNTLRFGKYLPAGFSDIQGSDGQVTDCDEDLDKNSTSCNQILPEVTVTGKKQKWSLKDLKGSITAGLDAVRNASDMYKAAKSTVSNVKSAVSNMTAQIKSGGGGLDGIINAAGAVANATGTIVNSGQVLANNIATNAGNLSNNIRDAGSTNAAREARAEAQETLDKLTKKCNAGNCSEQEKKYMEQMEETVNNNKTGVNKWLENDGAGGGSTILSGINKVGNIANNASNSVKNVANAANEGQSIGGDGALGKILGVGFGVGTAVTEGMDTAEQSKQNGMFDFRSDATKREEQAKAEEEAFKKTSGYVKNTQTTADGKKVETLGDGSVRTTSKDGKTVTTVNKDGTTTTTKDGTTVVKSPDGSRTVTDSAGNKVTYDAKGNKVKTELVNEYNRATAESVKEALNGKKEEEKKEEKKEEKPAATTQTTGSDLSKIKSALAEQCKSGDSICKTCANSVKSTDPNKAAAEAQACVEKLNAKQDELQKEYDQEMEKWCKQKGVKEECFMAPEGADANLTAACKKCGFKMASPSK
ncbi:MAG: hypothetical protein BHW57_01550 [Azospirillum sp. 47_25]|nr:MAG: hypothetical protein BHW57_01550 [Azospirillum sp. 47_25]